LDGVRPWVRIPDTTQCLDRCQADGGSHHFVPVHMELAIFIGSRIHDFGVQRNTHKRLLSYGSPKTNTIE